LNQMPFEIGNPVIHEQSLSNAWARPLPLLLPTQLEMVTRIFASFSFEPKSVVPE
jgi:hypothetical protein